MAKTKLLNDLGSDFRKAETFIEQMKTALKDGDLDDARILAGSIQSQFKSMDSQLDEIAQHMEKWTSRFQKIKAAIKPGLKEKRQAAEGSLKDLRGKVEAANAAFKEAAKNLLPLLAAPKKRT